MTTSYNYINTYIRIPTTMNAVAIHPVPSQEKKRKETSTKKLKQLIQHPRQMDIQIRLRPLNKRRLHKILHS
jgi:hypothetical protein